MFLPAWRNHIQKKYVCVFTSRIHEQMGLSCRVACVAQHMSDGAYIGHNYSHCIEMKLCFFAR